MEQNLVSLEPPVLTQLLLWERPFIFLEEEVLIIVLSNYNTQCQNEEINDWINR